MHEAQMHDDNVFLTLTYNDENLPKDGSLCLRDYQLFMKRLRKHVGQKVRFFHCGEYGDEFDRPHYHAILFGVDFPDKEPWSIRDDNTLYVSPTLTSIWGLGFCSIGDVTFESCAYVARYVMKKVNGDAAESHYQGRKPEYTTMSRRPGIGADWYRKFREEVFPRDFCVVNGVKVRVPKAYDRLEKEDREKEFDKVKRARRKSARLHEDDQTPERLAVREKVTEARVALLKRGFKDDP